MKERRIVLPDREVELDYNAFPESARQDLLRLHYRIWLEERKRPEYRAEFEAWLAKRNAAKAAT